MSNLLLVAIFGYIPWVLIQPLMHQQAVKFNDILPEFSTSVFALFFAILLKSISLQTKITDEGICVRFYPFQLKFKLYRWEDIKNVYIRDSNPLMEHKGWGIKGFGGNKAYSISGNIGLQITFVNDDRFFVGTQKREELKQALLQIQLAPFEAEKSL